jgi:hypothetical protein
MVECLSTQETMGLISSTGKKKRERDKEKSKKRKLVHQPE